MTEVALPTTAELALRAALALAAVLAVALISLRWLAKRGWRGRGGRSGRTLTLEARLGLDARRAVCIVRADGRRWLVGASDAGITLLAELEADPARAVSSADDPAEQAA